VIGAQGPSGVQGVTGTTGLAVPGTVQHASFGTPFFNNVIKGGPGELGNTVTAAGTSQIILTCPSGTLVSGGAQVLPADVPPAQAVRGILESSFPNPADSSQWIVTAEVTATSVNTNPAPPPGGPGLIVDPYVVCR